MKATAIAHPNIALTKYWGNKDPKLNIPYNNSISMNLSNCATKTTVEFSEKYNSDSVYIDEKLAPDRYNRKNPYLFIENIRKLAGIDKYAKVVSENDFPQRAGIASSASGAAALTVAATKAAGLNLDEAELSKLARLYSGSGCRSIPAGFVEWNAGSTHEDSYAKSIASPQYWDILDVVVVTNSQHKQYGSSLGHDLAETSPMFSARIETVKIYNDHMRRAISEKDFNTLGKYAEKDAMSLHAVMLTSDLSEKLNTTDISILYWQPETIQIMNFVKHMRTKGIMAYFTLDAGPNVHILTMPSNISTITDKLDILKSTGVIKELIINRPGKGARCIDDHLF